MACRGSDSDNTLDDFIKFGDSIENLREILHPCTHFPETSNECRKQDFGFQSLVMLYIS